MIIKPLVSLPEIKAFCDIRDSNTSNDEKLSAIAVVATRQIEALTKRNFAYQPHVEYFTSRDSERLRNDASGFNDSGYIAYAVPQTLYLRGLNVLTPSVEVWYDPQYVWDTPTKLTVDEDYEIEEGRDSLLLRTRTRYYRNAIKVGYNAGLGDADDDDLSSTAPPELKQACLFQIHFLRVKSRPDNVGMSAERTAGSKDRVVSTKFLSDGKLTPEAVALCAHLRRVGTGKS